MQSDVIIIGGGFAGTAAAITLARANRNVQLIDSGTPRNRFSEHSHGILGLDGVAPTELLERGHAEVNKFGGAHYPRHGGKPLPAFRAGPVASKSHRWHASRIPPCPRCYWSHRQAP